ncbi:unnamed protein product [Phytomonas sp. EM1]|nr:unnamed protein product [Phytomonas sp. EM1]|eukprot:CCW64046.1 unnamed protein product [Phytomonas sp. isolate EM1]
MRLFNSITLVMYEAEVLQALAEDNSGDVIVKVCRVYLEKDAFEDCIIKTAKARISYTPPEENVTLHHVLSIMQANGCAGPIACINETSWDIRPFQSNPLSTPPTQWIFATPPLNSAAARLEFQNTGLDNIFACAKSDVIYLSLTLSPLQEKSDSTCHTPRGGQKPLADATGTPHTPQKSLRLPGALTSPDRLPSPRSLNEDFSEASDAVKKCEEFSLSAQLRQWQRLQQRFQPEIDGLPPHAVLKVIQRELALWSGQKVEQWNGLWMLSLLELECETAIDTAVYGVATSQSGVIDEQCVVAASEAPLCRCLFVARQVTRVVDRLLRAAFRQKYRNKLGALPFSLLTVLLHVLRLRAVRHLSFATAALERLHDAPESSLPRQERLEQETLRSGEVVAAVLCRLNPSSLEWLPLAPTLLLGGLCIVEVAARCSAALNYVTRCHLVGLALVLFKVWQGITQDPRTAPHCVLDVFNKIRAEVLVKEGDGEKVAAMDEILNHVQQRYLVVESERVAFDPADLADYPPYIGYVGRWLWSMAAVDQTYQHGQLQYQLLRSSTKS